MKILLAVDGSAFSEAAAKSLANRPWPSDSEIKIITVMEPFQPFTIEPWAMPPAYWDDMNKLTRQQAEQAIEMAVEQFDKAQEMEISVEILQGNPKTVILDRAESWGADLIVLGSHGYTGLKRMFIGSVSQAVTSHAHCSVEVVRSREASLPTA